MKRRNPPPRSGAAAMLVVVTLLRGRAGAQSVDELRRDVETMKTQIQQLQQKMKTQEELIEKLSKQPAAAQAAPAPATPSAVETQLEKRVTDNVVREIQPSLNAANKTFPAQFNPAIGVSVDTAASYKENERADFEFRSAELALSASVDPFARGYAIFNGTNDGFEVEEAAIVTTSLPYNLTLKGGRFFADVGRLSKFHDHDLPFVNRPVVLDHFIGGEAQADGLELSYLAPLSQYLTFTVGAYDKIGGENSRVDNGVPRNFSKFSYLFRPVTYFNLNDSSSIELGATYAYTPKVDSFSVDGTTYDRDGKPRHLGTLDFTYRYTPLSQAAYRGLVWGTEVLYNREDWNTANDDEPVFRRTDAWGMYSYVEARLTRRYYPGFLFEYSQAIDRSTGNTIAYSPYFTIWASEFQRIRLQYTYLGAPQNHESQFFAQWTIVIGSHVHGFRDR